MADGFHTFFFPLFSCPLVLPGEESVVGVFQVGSKGRKEGGKVTDDGHVVAASPIDHVLTDDHSQPVAMIIPSFIFRFDVFTQHIVAQGFHDSNVINQSFIGRGSVKAVRPVPLIQCAHQETGVMVKTKYRDKAGFRVSLVFSIDIKAFGKAWYLQLNIRGLLLRVCLQGTVFNGKNAHGKIALYRIFSQGDSHRV